MFSYTNLNACSINLLIIVVLLDSEGWRCLQLFNLTSHNKCSLHHWQMAKGGIAGLAMVSNSPGSWRSLGRREQWSSTRSSQLLKPSALLGHKGLNVSIKSCRFQHWMHAHWPILSISLSAFQAKEALATIRFINVSFWHCWEWCHAHELFEDNSTGARKHFLWDSNPTIFGLEVRRLVH